MTSITGSCSDHGCRLPVDLRVTSDYDRGLCDWITLGQNGLWNMVRRGTILKVTM